MANALTTNLQLRKPARGDGLWDVPLNANFDAIDTAFAQLGINVRWLGATGNGTTDDTVAVQAAIDAATAINTFVYVPVGEYKVTSLTVPSGCMLRGAGWLLTATDIIGSVIAGTDGSDVFTMPSGGFFRDMFFRDFAIREGTNHIVVPNDGLGTGSSGISNVGFSNVLSFSPVEAGIRAKRHIEEWHLNQCEFRGGQYGVYTESTVGNFDKSTFNNCLWTGHTVNNCRLEATIANGVTFTNPVFNHASQHGVVINGGFRALTFINPNTEANGQSGKSNRTTGTITSSTASLVVASATGYAQGDPIVVAGAGTGGADLITTVDNIAGTTFTLGANAGNSVTAALTTNAQYDDFSIQSSVATSQDVTFIGGVIGGEASSGHLRYAIDASVASVVRVFSLGLSDYTNIPIYDPLHRVAGMPGTACSIRQPIGAALTDFGVGGSILADSTPSSQVRRTRIASPAGTDIDMLLVDSTRNGGGTYGSWRVRKLDGNRTPIVTVNATNATFAVGSTGTGLTQISVYTPSLTPASVATITTAEQTFTVNGLATTDKVIVNPPAQTAGVSVAAARVSAANTLALTFVNPTAGSLTPAAGTYTVIAIRS